MRSNFFILNLLLAALSTVLTIAVLACSAHVLSTFNNQQSSNVWLLPVWRDHFDVKDLQLLVATSVVILVLNIAYIVSTALSRLPSAALNTTITGLSTAIALVALIYPSAMSNHKSEFIDTVSTWTCSWSTSDLQANGGPSDFTTMCTESRFSYFTIIPIFIFQLILLATSIYAPVASRRRAQVYGQGIEKGHSLESYQRQESWDAAQDSQKAHAVQSVNAVHAQ